MLHTVRKGCIQPAGIQHLSTLLKVIDPLHHLRNTFLHDRLQLPDILHGEERVQRSTSDLMLIMVDSGKHGVVHAKGLRKPVVLVAFLAAGAAGIDHIVEICIGAVELPWRDADDGSVLFVQLDELEGVLAIEDQVIVKLVPESG